MAGVWSIWNAGFFGDTFFKILNQTRLNQSEKRRRRKERKRKEHFSWHKMAPPEADPGVVGFLETTRITMKFFAQLLKVMIAIFTQVSIHRYFVLFIIGFQAVRSTLNSVQNAGLEALKVKSHSDFIIGECDLKKKCEKAFPEFDVQKINRALQNVTFSNSTYHNINRYVSTELSMDKEQCLIESARSAIEITLCMPLPNYFIIGDMFNNYCASFDILPSETKRVVACKQ